jgi:Cu+-exporting ATPase
MEIKPDQAVGQSQHGGQTYYFCSNGCKQRFDQNPREYTAKPTPPQSQQRR